MSTRATASPGAPTGLLARAPAEIGIRVHALPVGRLRGNETFFRGGGYRSLLRRPKYIEFPVYSFVIEHPEGLVVIDAGFGSPPHIPRAQRRAVPVAVHEPDAGVAQQMRARGLRPEDVRRVVVTHLDWDHVGGIGDFPGAEVLVHRPEREYASTGPGRLRYQPGRWPAGFQPVLFDLDARPYGPFERSKRLTEAGDLVAVPLPGHSIGQVGVVLRTDAGALFFTSDHMLRQDWFLEDYERGRLIQLGVFFREQAVDTSRRIHQFAEEVPTVLLPSHDEDAPARLRGG